MLKIAVIVVPAFCVVLVVRSCVVLVVRSCVVLVVGSCVVFSREVLVEVLFANTITKVIIKKYEIVPLFK